MRLYVCPYAKYEYPNSKSLSACVTLVFFLVCEIDLIISRCSWQGIGKKNIYTVAAVWFFLTYILDSRCLDLSRTELIFFFKEMVVMSLMCTVIT